MKKLALILALTTATPVLAGGPVILEETYSAPAERDNSWVLPVIGLLIVGALIASGGGDDAPVDEPQPCKFTGEGGC